jgi:hypothetical protein
VQERAENTLELIGITNKVTNVLFLHNTYVF